MQFSRNIAVKELLRIMLVVEDNKTHVNWHVGMPVNPMNYGGDVVVVIDPGKTNMAVVISTPQTVVLKHFEFSGNNRGRGPVMDTTLYCEEFRAFLWAYLANVHLYVVAIEEAVTYKKGNSPYNYHQSNLCLTEIRGNVLNFFIERFGIRCIEVNNWAWKSHVLPEGYRSQSEKGSKRMFTELLPEMPYKDYFAADMCDVICILWFICDTQCSTYTMFCNRIEDCVREYKYTYVPVGQEVYTKIPEYPLNANFTLQQNINYYANRVFKPFSIVVDMSSVDVDDVYEHSSWFTDKNLRDTEVRVVVLRK